MYSRLLSPHGHYPYLYPIRTAGYPSELLLKQLVFSLPRTTVPVRALILHLLGYSVGLLSAPALSIFVFLSFFFPNWCQSNDAYISVLLSCLKFVKVSAWFKLQQRAGGKNNGIHACHHTFDMNNKLYNGKRTVLLFSQWALVVKNIIWQMESALTLSSAPCPPQNHPGTCLPNTHGHFHDLAANKVKPCLAVSSWECSKRSVACVVLVMKYFSYPLLE